MRVDPGNTTDDHFLWDHGGEMADVELEPSTETNANAYREAARKLRDWMLRANMWIAGQKNTAMAWEISLLAMGQGQLIGMKSEVELARRWRFTKAHISDLTKRFQDFVGMPPAIGQRTPGQCDGFSAARKKQLQNRKALR